MCLVVDKIVELIHNNYTNKKYSVMISGMDRTVVRDFSGFVRNISSKLGNDFILYKEERDFMIFKKDGTYVLIDYSFMYCSAIEFEVNMFESMDDIDRYLSYDSSDNDAN